MLIIGMAGRARSGKDTVADRLVQAHGFQKFSFSDRLYEQVSYAFDVPIAFLHDSKTKDVPCVEMSLAYCGDEKFALLMLRSGLVRSPWLPLSPRKILQWWGTEYRRGQDPLYWIKAANDWLEMVLAQRELDDTGWPAGVVNTSVRFPNEAAWLRSVGGQIWHIFRENTPANDGADHVAEIPLTVLPEDRCIFSKGSIDSLRTGVSVFLGTNARSLTILPPDDLSGATGVVR